MAAVKDPYARRLLNRLSTWFPVLLLASLAMLTYWLDAQVKGGGRDARTGPGDPDYFLEDFAATSFGKDGSVIQHLAAKKLAHYPDGQPTLVEAPHLTDTQPGKPPMRVRADSGSVSGDNEHVYLTGNVVLERDAAAGRGKITLASEYLHVQPKLERADTDRRVTITDATGTHAGGALVVDNKARTLKLSNGVTGEIRPASR
ncbi:MAG: LPS export ABC transporter periplasmic protein LptC [Betaproteobacteria bacterium]|nr:LPS export ABC transporter periplasmic protein LptC [Betaproteobacteria bacterium]